MPNNVKNEAVDRNEREVVRLSDRKMRSVPGVLCAGKFDLACSETSGNNRMLRMSRAMSIALAVPLVASPNQAMRSIQVSRKKLYELINTGELESYTEGKSRRITVKSINDYIERRLAAEAIRRGRATSHEDGQSRS
jgi:excisionase family DNA binding protein